MSGRLSIDLREFDAALKQYVAASKRPMQDSVNRCAGNLCYFAARSAPQGSKQAIRQLKTARWWPAFISKVLTQAGGYTLKFKQRLDVKGKKLEKLRKSLRSVRWIDSPTGRVSPHKRRSRSVFRHVGAGFKRADARRVSAKLISGRAARVKSFVAIFARLAGEFGRSVNRAGSKSYYRKFWGTRKATARTLEATFRFSFDNRHKPWPGGTRPSPSADVAKKAQIAEKALAAAVPQAAADMRAYVEKKMAAAARQHSAK